MKLRTFKELKYGKFKNIDIQDTITGGVFEVIHTLVYFMCLLLVIIMCYLGYFWSLLFILCFYIVFLVISAFIIRYFYLCEIYMGEKGE